MRPTHRHILELLVVLLAVRVAGLDQICGGAKPTARRGLCTAICFAGAR